MKALLLALSLFSTALAAAPVTVASPNGKVTIAPGVANMVAQCEEVMRCKMCQVTNDKHPKGAKKTISFVDVNGDSQSEEVDAAAYDWYREPGYTKNKRTGKFLMCERVALAMKDPTSTRGRGAATGFSKGWRIGDTYCPPDRP